jgi:hypothetical protein
MMRRRKSVAIARIDVLAGFGPAVRLAPFGWPFGYSGRSPAGPVHIRICADSISFIGIVALFGYGCKRCGRKWRYKTSSRPCPR